MADGSIRIYTKLETKEAQADLVKLEKECEKTAQKIGEAGGKMKAVFTGMSTGQLSGAFKTANRELAKTEKALAEIEEQMAVVRAQTDEMLPYSVTDEQTANLLAMEEQQLGPLLQQRDELTAKAAEYKRQIESITAELEKQKQAEAAQAALKDAGKAAISDEAFLGKIRSEEQYHAVLAETRAQMAAIEQQAARISQETGVPAKHLLEQDARYQELARKAALLADNQARFEGKVDDSAGALRKFGRAGADAGNKTSKAMKKATGSTNTLGAAIKKGIKKMGKMALACLGIRAAFSAVRKAANSYMEDNEQLSQQMQALWNIAGQAIGPVIEMMVKGISTAVAWVNTLITALTGVDLVARANAAALKKQAKATQEAAKAAQLAGFDEMNKLNDNSSSGADAGGAATFDNSLVGDVPNFIEKMKEQILAGDWYGAGVTLGTALMDGIKSVKWHSVGQWIGDALVNAASFALGFIFSIDPMELVGAINNFLGGLMEGLAKGLQGLDWAEIGGKIVDLLCFGLLWAIASANPLAGILMFMLTPNSGELASGAAELVGTIIGSLARAVIGSVKRIGEIGIAIWTAIKGYFDDYVNWEGTPEEIINGLFQGILEALKGIGTWIYDNIWVPFRDGFKKAFGIASPSKKMKELGGYIVDGLVEGIKNIGTKVQTFFTDCRTKIEKVFANIGTWFSKKFTEAWTGIKNAFSSVGSFFSNIWTTIKDKFTTIGTTIGNAIGGAFKNVVNSIISFAENTINGFIRAINSAIGLINKIPGVNIKTISTLTIPKLAKGGIVNNPGRGVLATVGEAGAEAVLPLENNTEWMDILADKINAGVQKIVVPIYLNGRKIAEEVIDITNKRNFATNGAI